MENVTEELVRQNGNQAAAVMADYAGQGGGGGEGGGGSTSGIPTIDKNIQPNIVWREPTAEDLAKFHSQRIEKVADLTEGKLPLFLVMNEPYDGVDYVMMSNVASVEPPEDENDDIHVGLGDGTNTLLAEDWSLLGKEGVN